MKKAGEKDPGRELRVAVPVGWGEERLAGWGRERVEKVRGALPAGGLFSGHQWRVAPGAFVLGRGLVDEIERFGRIFLQFNRAVNLLYRLSVAGRQPAWVAEWLDRGKPAELVALQRHPAWKNAVPRVIRPDILLTEDSWYITELDSVPGGIGLTGWLQAQYHGLAGARARAGAGADGTVGTGEGGGSEPEEMDGAEIVGGVRGMRDGFAGIFGEAERVHIVVSDEAATYRPEMEWLAGDLNRGGAGEGPEGQQGPQGRGDGGGRFAVRDGAFSGVRAGDAVYRFFEMFDLGNVPGAAGLLAEATAGRVQMTPAPKPLFEEKQLFALLWNRNLEEFWRQELGSGFVRDLRARVPYTWLLDPSPLPPHGAIPELGLTDWRQLKGLSQRDRSLILKASGFSEVAWGARSVVLGSDVSAGDWAAAVDRALAEFPRTPYVLQRYMKPRTVSAAWYNAAAGRMEAMAGRVRLCPYYFVRGDGDAARAGLGGVLATICPADKKILHGMRDAILAPCSV